MSGSVKVSTPIEVKTPVGVSAPVDPTTTMETQNGISTEKTESLRTPQVNGHAKLPESAHVDKSPSEKVVAVEGITGVEEKDTTPYLNNYKAHKTGISHDEMVKAYTEWAAAYDKDLCPGRYNGPEIAASSIASFYSDEKVRADLTILDVAAGTGRVGEELVKFGFRDLHALEPSEGMLLVLKEKTHDGNPIYSTTYRCAIGVESECDIPNDLYDCLVIAGGMGEGHIPVNALDDMIRLVKPGGTIFIVMREEYLTYVKEYVDRLEPYMDALEQRGKWKRIDRRVVPHYSFNKNGVVFGYQVLRKQVSE